jgi:hypothetical protein
MWRPGLPPLALPSLVVFSPLIPLRSPLSVVDGSGWYQLLRRFKKDDLQGRSISSLSVYPDRAKGYLLVLALPCLKEVKEPNGETGATLTSSLLKLYDLGSYRLVSPLLPPSFLSSPRRDRLSNHTSLPLSGLVELFIVSMGLSSPLPFVVHPSQLTEGL